MTGHQIAAFAVVGISLAVGPRAAGVQAAATLRVIASVDDHADVPVEVLAAARSTADRIYREVGVDVTWATHCRRGAPVGKACADDLAPADPASASDVRVRLRIWSDRMSAGVKPASMLGFALEKASCVYILYDRISVFAVTRKLHVGSLLGHTIAHEMGHVLIGGLAHARKGIMQPHWGGEDVFRFRGATLSFLPDEAQRMRSRMLAHARAAEARVASAQPVR